MGNAATARHLEGPANDFEWPSLADACLPQALRGKLKYLQLPNGDAYFGPIDRNGLPGGGNGIILYRDGSAFVGRLERGKRKGDGTFVHAATDVQYDGGWDEDHWDGEGSLYSVHDGTVLEGVWKRGELIGEGLRRDMNTGMTWTERYSNGQLVSQKLVNLHSTKSSVSSSHTSSDNESSSGRVHPAVTSDAAHSGDEKTRHAPCRAATIPWTKPIALWRPGALSTIVGSPSFLQYCQNGDAGRFSHRASEGRLAAIVDFPANANRSSEDDRGLLTMNAVLAWTSDDVLTWLSSFGMPASVLEAFRSHQLTGLQLLCSTNRDTLKKDIGIFAFGYRAKIIENLKLLKLQIRLNEERLATSTSQYESLFKMHSDSQLESPSLTSATLAANNFHIPFDQLEFIELLGGDKQFFSSTYRGRWLGKSIAIKVFTAFLVDQAAWNSYVNSLVELRHPHLVLILGVSVRHPDLHCIVMEYAPHKSLLDLLHGDEVHKHFDAWTRQPAATYSSWLGAWAFGSRRRIPATQLVTITSDEAGSCMPLNQTTETGFHDDESALLTVGKTAYPMTTPICPHLDPMLEALIPLSTQPTFAHMKTIEDKTDGHVFSNTALASVAKGIVLGCLYLAQRQVFHLNLKPSNVLMDETFNPKLTDFGQSKLSRAFTNAPLLSVVSNYNRVQPNQNPCGGLLELTEISNNHNKMAQCPNCHKSFDLTLPGGPMIEATMRRPRRLQWCAPEVLRLPMSHIGVGVESDVYSFGMILWHLLAHQIPFVGLSSTHIRVAVGFAGFQPPIEKIWLPLKKIVSSCLEFVPSDRPTFEQILFSLVNIHQSATTTAEDALLTFMQGTT